MTDEEKKAFSRLYMKATLYSADAEDYPNSIVSKRDLVIIINLIEKQQKEIENLKEINKEHQKLNGELRDEIDDLKQLMAHKNSYTKQLEEDLFENASNYVVSKDKIRAKIKEYDDFYKEYPIEFRKYKMRPIIVVLQELLEEE